MGVFISVIICIIIAPFTLFPAYYDYFTRTRKGKPSAFTGTAKVARDGIIILPIACAIGFIIILIVLWITGQI